MAISPNYTKSAKISDKDPSYGVTHYTDKTKNILGRADKNALLDFSCSDSFYRNIQGVYIFDNLRTDQMHVKRIKNDEFIEFMREKERSLPRGKKVLAGRVCELSDKTVLLFYSIGAYDTKLADSTTTRKAIAYSTDNSAFLEILPKGLLNFNRNIEIGNSQNYFNCTQPFQLTKQKLFVLCEEEKEWESNYVVLEVNLTNGKITVVEKCINRHRDKLETKCA
jgi:hypothetical protein